MTSGRDQSQTACTSTVFLNHSATLHPLYSKQNNTKIPIRPKKPNNNSMLFFKKAKPLKDWVAVEQCGQSCGENGRKEIVLFNNTHNIF